MPGSNKAGEVTPKTAASLNKLNVKPVERKVVRTTNILRNVSVCLFLLRVTLQSQRPEKYQSHPGSQRLIKSGVFSNRLASRCWRLLGEIGHKELLRFCRCNTTNCVSLTSRSLWQYRKYWKRHHLPSPRNWSATIMQSLVIRQTTGNCS